MSGRRDAARWDTDALIADLAARPAVGRGPGASLGRALPPSLLVAAAALLVVYDVRGDIVAAMTGAVTAAKWALPIAVAAVALPLALRRARPEARVGARGLLFVPIVAIAIVLAASALADMPRAEWGAAIRGGTRLSCLAGVTSLSLAPLAATLWALRRGATTEPRLSGLLAGLGSGGLAAALYALKCMEDAAPFFVTWYGAAILIAGGLGALLGPRVLRW